MPDHILDHVTLGALVIVRDKMMALQAAGRKVYRLEVGDTSFDTPTHVQKAIIDALQSGKTHYPPSTGLPALREAILKKVHEKNHLPIRDADHVMVTIGGMHGLYMAFCALLSPGDEVILPDPMWSEIAELIRRPGGVPVPIVLRPDKSFLYDPVEIQRAITPRTKAIYVNTPHNPIGTVLSEATLKQIAEIAVHHDLAVVSDEAYEDVLFDGMRHVSIGSFPGMADRTISSYTFSKSYAMTGLRLGYLVSNDDKLIERFQKLLRLTTNGVPSITQWGGLAALNGPQQTTREMMTELERRRDIFFKGLETLKVFETFKPQGAFYAWAKISDSWKGYEGKRDSWAMTNYLLDQAGIGSSPGIAFGASGEGYVRFAFTVAPELLIESIEVMQDLFNK